MRNNQGFTLIETIMVITLLGIVAVIIAIPLSQGVKGWFQATSREGITQSGIIGIERMAREIRNTARIDSNANPTWCPTTACTTPPCYCPCISTATATNFVFSDMNGDISNTPTGCTSTNFNFSGSSITRTDTSGAATLADNVQSMTITYYNSANTSIATPVSAANRPKICHLSIEITSTQGEEILLKYAEVYLSNMRGALNSAQNCQTMNQ